MSQGNTFPNFFPSQLFPFFTLPCSFLSIVKKKKPKPKKQKNSSLSHVEKFSYFPLLTPCQVLGSSLSIASRGLFTKTVCCLLPGVLARKKGSPLVPWDACLSPPRHWGPLRTEAMRQTSFIVAGMVMRMK